MLNILDAGTPLGMGYGQVFDPWDHTSDEFRDIPWLKENITKFDLVVLGGGADIHPHLYGHQKAGAYTGEQPSWRDKMEKEICDIAIANKKPIFGICRGAQMVCVAAGGKLIQHLDQHPGGRHPIETNDGRTIEMTSAHHQMMWPLGIQHEVLAWHNKSRKSCHSWRYYIKDYPGDVNVEGDNVYPKDIDPMKDLEAVYFPTINAVGIQGHPEFFSNPMEEGVVYSRQLVNKYLLNGAMPNV